MNRLLTLSLLFILFGCDKKGINDPDKRNENWTWWVDAKTGVGEWIPNTGNTTVKNGNYTMFFFNGRVIEKGKLLEGKNVDTIFFFDLNEKLVKYKILKQGQKTESYFIYNGLYKNYYPTGEILEEGPVINHRVGKKWVVYFKNGKPEWINNFNNDTGWTVWYYEHGQVEDSSYFINSLESGTRKRWHENGRIKEITNWKMGVNYGENKMYFDNGQLKHISHCKMGVCDGANMIFNEQGQMVDSFSTINSKVQGTRQTWYNNAQKMVTMNYNNGIYNGEYLYYYENGQLQSEGIFRNGNLVGIFKYYDDKGKLTKRETYLNGKLVTTELE